MRVSNTNPTTVISHGAPEAVAATIDLLCEFIGAKVVHEDLRQPLHDGLYVERLKDEGRRGELWPRLSSHSPPLLVTLLDPVLVALGDALDRLGRGLAVTLALAPALA